MSAKPKVNFSLSKKRKKTSASSSSQTKEAGFADDGGNTSVRKAVENRRRDASPLVIPLLRPPLAPPAPSEANNSSVVKNSTKHVNVSNKPTDEEAAASLISATTDKQLVEDGSTNFSAAGSLIISQPNGDPASKLSRQGNRQKNKQPLLLPSRRRGLSDPPQSQSDDAKFKSDISHCPEDIAIDSEAYEAVPVSEFGAAMLRGMGWTGTDLSTSKNNGKDGIFKARNHRLGLGAVPKPVAVSSSGVKLGGRHRARRIGDNRKKAEEENEEMWKAKVEEKIRLDKQATMQVGSIVRVREDGAEERRAKMVKIAGVPGLNRVLVRYELDSVDTSVKRGDVALVARADLDSNPFKDRKSVTESGVKTSNNNNCEGHNDHKEHDQGDGRKNESDKGNFSRRDSHRRSDRTHRQGGNHERGREEGASDRTSDRRVGDHKRYNDNKRSNSDGRSSKDNGRGAWRDGWKSCESRLDRSRKSNRSRNMRASESLSPKPSSPEREDHWLLPNIRVRVVSRKIARGRQYKQKGLVVDVTRGGTEATLHMSDGELIEHVPERYLETALPKMGGNAVVLTGQHRFEKGRLLERSSELGNCVLQMFEDMNVLTLSLDDIAEWCGSLDNDTEE